MEANERRTTYTNFVNLSIKQGFSVYCGAIKLDYKKTREFLEKGVWTIASQASGVTKPVYEVKLTNDNKTYCCGSVIYEEQSREQMETLFNRGFIHAFYPEKGKYDMNDYDKIKHYRVSINNSLVVQKECKEKELRAFIQCIDLYLYPTGIVIVTISTDNTGITLEQLYVQNHKMKMVNWYDKTYSNDYLAIFYPLLHLKDLSSKKMSRADIWETDTKRAFHHLFIGNKFYLYSVTQLTECKFDDLYNFENLTYDISQVIPIGASVNPTEEYHPSRLYYDDFVKNNILSVYNDWMAMVSPDGMSVVMKQSCDERNYVQWKKNRLYVFLLSLYIKIHLVHINSYWQLRTADKGFEEEFMKFDRMFNLRIVSFTFLPQLIYEKCRLGFKIDEDINAVKEKVRRYFDKKEQNQNLWLNVVMALLAGLAVTSAFNDGIELFHKMHPDIYPLHFIDGVGRLLFYIFVFLLIIYVFYQILKNKNLIK